MTRDGSATTSTDARAAHGGAPAAPPRDRRRARAGGDGARCRGSASCPPDQRRRAYRDGALRIGEGQTISQPWIVACMASCSSCAATSACSRWAPGRATRPRCCRALCAQVVTIERYESLAQDAAATLAELGYDNVEVRVGDGARGRPRPRAVRRHLRHRHRRRTSRPPALLEQLGAGRRARLPGRARAARAPDPRPRRRARRPSRRCASCRWSSDDE